MSASAAIPSAAVGRKVYMLPRDIEQKWIDMHERETGVGIPPD
jgi:hypothetical protein